MKIAIMQPYFLPYAGYFRLMAATDLFVIYDCVQFPRRGWVHRNRFRKRNGELDYLTLPLQKAPQDTRIDALRFAAGREEEWRGEMNKFPSFLQPVLQEMGITKAAEHFFGTPVDYLERLLKVCSEALGLPFRVARSSALNLPVELRGQDRILAVCTHFGAKTYVNSPGGRALYQNDAFRERGVDLRFLSDYQGDMSSIAQRLADAPTLDGLRHEINSQCILSE